MKLEKVEKFVANLSDKTEYIIHIRNLKQALNHGLILKKLHRVMIFWSKSLAKIKAKTKRKNFIFEKDAFKLMNNVDFGKTMENLRKHRNITLVTTQKRRNYLVPKPNY